jgi:CubicO group peptidase (beta-lactamase class C family)
MNEATQGAKRFLYPLGFFILLIGLTSPSTAQSRFTKLDDWMENQTKAMGGRAILVIYKNGQILYDKSVKDMRPGQKTLDKYLAKKQGMQADVSEYTLDSPQPVASCSKWFSAALVMTFVDEGSLQLSDTVGKYLPILSAKGKGNITLADCLSHLTGIKAPPLRESLKQVKNMKNMQDALEEIAGMPMEGEPGKTFHYSSVGLQIAASVIEKISGKSFQTLFEERITQPLEMKNTDFGHRALVLPAGGAVSTPVDYLHFLTMILNKGTYQGKKILSPESVNRMEKNVLGPDVKIEYIPEQADGMGYGFGEWVLKDTPKDEPSKWVTSPGLFGSFPWVDNDHQYCAFLMTFYLSSKGRQDRYFTLKKLVDESIP